MLMFLKDGPAAIIKLGIKKYLIVADLHIGITRELRSFGIYLPSQAEVFANKLNDLAKKTRAKNLIIVGDLKHNIRGADKKEVYDIMKFLYKLDFDKIIIIKGNHDGNIDKIVKNVTKKILIERRFMKIGNILLTHGHVSIKENIKAKKIVIAHIHPHIKMVDRLKATYYERVWLRYRDPEGMEIIIMPNFNDFCGATIVNEQDLIGPIARKINKKEFDVYLLDGTYLGKIKDFNIN